MRAPSIKGESLIKATLKSALGLVFIAVTPAQANSGFASIASGIVTSTLLGISPQAQNTVRSAARDIERHLGRKAQRSHHEFRAARWNSERDAQTARFQHYYQGVEVVGSQAIHSSPTSEGSRAGESTWMRDRIAEFDVSTQPRLSPQEAAGLAQFRYLGQRLEAQPLLKILPSNEGAAKLLYQIKLSSGAGKSAIDLLVDANTGALVAEIPTQIDVDVPTQSETQDTLQMRNDFSSLGYANVRVLNGAKKAVLIERKSGGVGPFAGCVIKDLGGVTPDEELDAVECARIVMGKNEQMNALCQWVDAKDGWPLRIAAENCEVEHDTQQMQFGFDEAGRRAAMNSNLILSYFRKNFRRESFDGKATPVVSVVHGGKGMRNAYWDSRAQMMTYGDGDGERRLDYTRGVDIAGHEFTHAIVSNTADFMHFGEAGALNEAYADFFGELIAAGDGTPDWVLGTDVVAEKYKDIDKGIRNLKDPGAIKERQRALNTIVETPYPSTMAEKRGGSGSSTTCSRDNDYCWVHFNATIPGHASYLVVQAIGAEKAQKLYYRTLTRSLTSNETFTSAAKATVDMCAQMYDASTCDSVKGAFRQVGLVQ